MIQKITKLKQKLNDNAGALIHCITNPISINDCANVVLALGGKPIMAEHPQEVSEITQTAKALLVNLGNITDVRMKSMMISGKTALLCNIPTVIDVVGVSCSKLRLDFAHDFIEKYKPKVIKGNLSELKALVGLKSNSLGVDVSSKDIIDTDVLETLVNYSKKHNAVMLASGETDLIVYEDRVYKIRNGTSTLSQITGTGCMLGVMVATCISMGDYLEGTILATAILGIAGELSDNPKGLVGLVGLGSFRVSLMDNISLLDENTIANKIRLEIM